MIISTELKIILKNDSKLEREIAGKLSKDSRFRRVAYNQNGWCFKTTHMSVEEFMEEFTKCQTKS